MTRREIRYRQLFSKQRSDGSLVDFRKFSDVSMVEFATLIRQEGSSELRAGVTVATDVTSDVKFQRFEQATRLLLDGTYFSEDIDVCVAAVQQLYAENTGILFLISSAFLFSA